MLRFHLYKENKDTQEALGVIGKMLGIQVCHFFCIGNCLALWCSLSWQWKKVNSKLLLLPLSPSFCHFLLWFVGHSSQIRIGIRVGYGMKPQFETILVSGHLLNFPAFCVYKWVHTSLLFLIIIIIIFKSLNKE